MVQSFGQPQIGIVTSLSDAQLPALNRMMSEQTLITVRPFGEVVRQIHQITGETTPWLVTGRQFQTAVAHACNRLSSASPFRHVADRQGFHELVCDLLTEFGHWGYRPIDLDACGPKVSDRLGRWIHDLSQIWKECERLFDQARIATSSQLMHECMASTPDIDGQESRLLVLAGREVHPLAMRWLQWLAQLGSEVQVVYYRHASEGNVFQAVDDFLARLGVTGRSPGVGSHLLTQLFAVDPKPGVHSGLVEIHESGDPLSESEWALRRAAELSDLGTVALFARDLDLYGPLLSAAAERFELPIEVPRRVKLMTSGFAKFLVQVLEIMLDGTVADLKKCLNHSYLRSGSEQDEKLRQLMDEVMVDPARSWDLLSERLFEADTECFTGRVLNHVIRSRSEAKAESRNRLGWQLFLREFAESGPWFDRWVHSPTQQADMRCFTTLLSSLAQDASMEEEEAEDLRSFSAWIEHARRVWDRAEVTLPRTEADILVAGDLGTIGEVDYLIALGMNEGNFPRRRKEDPILSDEDRAELSQAIGGPPLHHSFDRAFAERDLFYMACATGTKGIILSYPASPQESDHIRAHYLSEVARLCTNAVFVHHPKRNLAPVSGEFRFEADRRLAAAEASPKVLEPGNELVSEPASALVRLADQPVKLDRLVKLSQCAFSFSASRLFPERIDEREYWSRLAELPRKARLLTQPTPESAERALVIAYDQLIDSLPKTLPRWEREYIEKGASELIRGWVEREFAARELWHRTPATTREDVSIRDLTVSPRFLQFTLDARFDGFSEGETYRRLHLVRRSVRGGAYDKDADELAARYGFYLAIASIGTPAKIAQLEIETLSHERVLISYTARAGHRQMIFNGNLREVAIAPSRLRNAAPSELRTELKESILQRIAVNRDLAQAGLLVATPGDHCKYCDYAGLCRVKDQPVEDERGTG